MAEKLAYAEERLSWVPGLLLLEPRGHKDMFGAILVPPCSPAADIGALFLDNKGYEPMCGHAVIGIVTILLETGMFEMVEPETLITLDTPSGRVHAYAQIEGGRVVVVSFENVPSFVYRSDVTLKVPEGSNSSQQMPCDWLIWACASWQQPMSKSQSGTLSCHTLTKSLT